MVKHADIWHAIDTLAARRGLSASGLAKRARLDPTTFNKSKRMTRDGRPRWPSTESIAKILEATGATLGEFTNYASGGKTSGGLQNIPLIGMAQAGAKGFFDDAGYPVGGGWEDVNFPEIGDPHAYALEISGDSMEPVYRDGDIVIVCPQANVRRGDRVVVKTKSGEVMAKMLKRQTAHKLELKSLNPEHPDLVFSDNDVDWVARILWASQ